MIRMHGRISGAVILLAMTALLLTGCTSEASSISSAKNKADGADAVDTGFTMSTVGSYDSADTAVVLMTDETNKAVVLINKETGKQYTLYYDGTTYVKDKHDGPMTISQIQAGDVVDVTFLKGRKKLASIQLSPRAWVYDDVYNYDLAGANGTASIGSQKYSLPEGAVVLSEGKRVDKAEVVSQDVVTFSGIDHEIYSVSVDKGHGYLSLKNEQPLLGGWIEVGNSVIRQVTEDMLLVVPEGTYQVALSNNGIGCVKNVTIERDKEVVLDVDDIEIPEDKTGKILFDVAPETAKVSVDGEPVDISKAVELPYGIHRVEATADGYDTLAKYIQVGSEYATISFTLEESRKEDKDSVSENSITREPWQDTEDIEDTYAPAEVSSVSDNTLSSPSENTLRSSQNGKVDIVVKDLDTDRELEGVTVRLEVKDSDKKLLDGYPKTRTSPCSFSKNEDAYTYQFLLSKDGYETKTFEPDLEDYQKDETIYFWLQKKTSSGQTTSSDKGFSAEVISAIATAGASCSLTNEIDAFIPPQGNLGNLTLSGKNAVESAVTNAVKKVVGTEGFTGYYFKIADTLEEVTALASGDYEGTVSVTITKSGYKETKVPVRLVIKKKAEEEPEPENKIAVSVSADSEEVKPGDTVTFTATVKNGEEPIEDATVSWKVEGQETGISYNELSISVNEDETRDSLTVTATYTDGESTYSESKTVKIIQESDPDPVPEPNPTPDPNPVTPTEPDTEEGNGKDEPVEETKPDTTNPVLPAEPDTEKGDEKDEKDENGTTEGSDNTDTTTDATNTTDKLTEEKVTIKQNAHPIRDFFSSLFK